MSVLELCDREIAAVPLDATVADAIHKMLDYHVGAVAIVDSEYRVAGIFTERDVLRKMSLTRLDPQTTSIRDLMTTPVEMATRETGCRGSAQHYAGEPFPALAGRRRQWQAAGHSFHPQSAGVARGPAQPRVGFP